MIEPHIRDTIAIFAAAMDRKLQRDDTIKQAWETEAMIALFDGLKDELSELHDAFVRREYAGEDVDGKAMMEECCDVALYAMMIFSQLHPLTRHNRRGVTEHRLPRVTK